ncbi:MULTISPECIES: IS21 family transposase [unclassified Chelatococcus]|uniref:IS21 family transposase n=1 Tax=unclassified Chelatococcus TaxID=2638111 RepID=UPI001BD02448|nr:MULTISPECIES: IS21 family transposase [unclassified Chelatococcus]MBS7743515.1 IS21 family transposase [Chelatococcus sp. HY11]MBX3547216.1 IS21 family transposase [Chelatococcus sp.]CAH1662231.1 transposase [Hyphomicrobiales bacterium]CAH1687474.1 transposase [Hyphomicrobiales bacterium]
MPTERLSMRRIRELLRLKYENGLSSRTIAASLGISKGAVGAYLSRARAAGLDWPLPEAMDDTALERRLFPGQPTAAEDRGPEPDWRHVDRELRRPAVTRALLWQEYRTEHPDGYGYSWFCERYEAWKQRASPTMRQRHAAGEKVFVDYAGDTIDVIEPITGEAQAMKLFVGALGASSYVYAEARPSEGLADWIGCHVGMFAAFGGVTSLTVCDNLKAAVTNADRYDPGLNRTYQDMARHYGTTILPARSRKPRDKSKVEVSVQIAQRWVLARLRNRRFFSLVELNQAIAELVADLNGRLMRGYGMSRAELFAAVDAPALKPLPAEPYAFAVWKRCRVAPDYHVEADGNWYSVPCRLIRELVDVRIADRTVEVFHKGERVASHAKCPGRRNHTTVADHMPSAHRRYALWTPARLTTAAEKIGPSTAALTMAIMAARPHPEQGFRTCMGILALQKTYGTERLEAACQRGNTIQARSVASIRSILKSGLDRAFLEPEPAKPVRHGNIRGRSYFH